MARDLDQITHLTFDVGGTVFDWHHGIKDEVTSLAAAQGVEIDAAQFANDWRREMFVGLAQVRSGDLPRMNADELHRRALDTVVPAHAPLELDAAGRDELTMVWLRQMTA